MKTRLLLWDSLPDVYGGQRVALNYIDALSGYFDWSVVMPANGSFESELKQRSIPCHKLFVGAYSQERKSLRDVVSFIFHTPRIIYLMVRFLVGIDILIVNSSRLFIWAGLLGLIKRKPQIWYAHNIIVGGMLMRFITILAMRAYVVTIVAVSEAVREQFPDNIRNKIVVVKNGVTMKQFIPRHRTIPSPWRFVSIGAIVPQKGHDVAIRGLALLQDVNWSLCIVGSPRPSTTGYARELIKIVSDLGLSNRISFVPFSHDIQSIYDAADCLILSSNTHETCGMVLLEAYACGIPAVGAKLEGIETIIEEGRTGYCFNVGSETSLAMAVRKITSLPHFEYMSMSRCCRLKVEGLHDIRATSLKFKLLIDEVNMLFNKA